MLPSALIAAAAVLGLPVLALALLVAIGDASPGHALIVASAVGAAGLFIVAWFVRDLSIVAETARRAAGEAAAGEQRTPFLPALERLSRDIERLVRTAALREAEVAGLRRADEAIVERLPDPLLVLAADRSIRRANAAARVDFGSDLPALLRHPALRSAIDRGIALGQPQTAELNLAAPVAREVLATVFVLDPPLADGGLAIVLLSDRTRERAVERMRADFVANASHELRTPLASLIGFIDTLRGPATDDPPAQQRFLGIMSEQAERMNRLIDDLLSLSRVELVEHQPPSEQVDVADLLNGLAAAFEPRLAARSVRLELTIDPRLQPITGDADQLAQVMQNLLDNAVKYGGRGGLVRVAAEAAPPGARWPTRRGVVVSVADRGPGIPRIHLPRLTERFYRVDTGRSRAEGGTGLGLAIVKHIVNRHRGQLVIESEEGAGTTISVWLPLVQPAPLPPRRAAEAD